MANILADVLGGSSITQEETSESIRYLRELGLSIEIDEETAQKLIEAAKKIEELRPGEGEDWLKKTIAYISEYPGDVAAYADEIIRRSLETEGKAQQSAVIAVGRNVNINPLTVECSLDLPPGALEPGMLIRNRSNGKITRIVSVEKNGDQRFGWSHRFTIEDDIGLRYTDIFDVITEVPAEPTSGAQELATGMLRDLSGLVDPAAFVTALSGRDIDPDDLAELNEYLARNWSEIHERALRNLSLAVTTFGQVTPGLAALAITHAVYSILGEKGAPANILPYLIPAAFDSRAIINVAKTIFPYFQDEALSALSRYNPLQLFQMFYGFFGNADSSYGTNLQGAFVSFIMRQIQVFLLQKAEVARQELFNIGSGYLAARLASPKKPSQFSKIGERKDLRVYLSELAKWKDFVLKTLEPEIRKSNAWFKYGEAIKELHDIIDDAPPGADLEYVLEKLAEKGYIGLSKDAIRELAKKLGG